MDISQSTIRAFVDGELPAEQAAEISRAAKNEDPALAARIAFERELRSRVARVMEATPRPAPSVEEIRATLAAADQRESMPADADSAQSEPVAGRILSSSVRINYLALAACIAIICGAVLFGIFGPPLHSWNSGSSGPDSVAAMTLTASEAMSEHRRCSTDPQALAAKIHYNRRQAIHENLDARLGRTIPLLDLRPAGFYLVGAGECGLSPVADRSIHVVYRHGDASRFLSIFMQPDVGQFDMEPGVPYSDDPNCAMLSDGSTVFIIVASTQGDQIVASDALLRHVDRQRR